MGEGSCARSRGPLVELLFNVSAMVAGFEGELIRVQTCGAPEELLARSIRARQALVGENRQRRIEPSK